ncbi:hypothetical protein PAAG_02174 [Paracoccidioides lutzii Pb01]|uniref:Uncharacterized protein n=1 Tax=Paracoccidioides lutzii (strain ATCC MYA-826 / Pb01) TaxID=502779 RepID=C1GUH9_PARBA|nr:hypothetical protein PAAG_02174 [Paracoccidioides lutzii Pb01]EEH39985.2 hypothetical protein PAAG_02174 [Paracoccidioides lutzii Pb01]
MSNRSLFKDILAELKGFTYPPNRDPLTRIVPILHFHLFRPSPLQVDIVLENQSGQTFSATLRLLARRIKLKQTFPSRIIFGPIMHLAFDIFGSLKLQRFTLSGEDLTQ